MLHQAPRIAAILQQTIPQQTIPQQTILQQTYRADDSLRGLQEQLELSMHIRHVQRPYPSVDLSFNTPCNRPHCLHTMPCPPCPVHHALPTCAMSCNESGATMTQQVHISQGLPDGDVGNRGSNREGTEAAKGREPRQQKGGNRGSKREGTEATAAVMAPLPTPLHPAAAPQAALTLTREVVITPSHESPLACPPLTAPPCPCPCHDVVTPGTTAALRTDTGNEALHSSCHRD